VPPKKTAISRANHLEGDSIYRPDKRNVKRGDIPLSANVEDNDLASDIVKGENIFGHPILKNVKNYHVKCPYCEEKAITISGLVSQSAAYLLFCISNYLSRSMHTRLIF
jgi:uncharacterized Zn-finger protein